MTRLQRTPVTGAAAARRTLRLLAVACILVAVAVKAGRHAWMVRKRVGLAPLLALTRYTHPAGRVISDGGAGPSTADTAAAPTTATATPAPKSTGSVLKATAGPSAGATAAARGLKQWMPWCARRGVRCCCWLLACCGWPFPHLPVRGYAPCMCWSPAVDKGPINNIHPCLTALSCRRRSNFDTDKLTALLQVRLHGWPQGRESVTASTIATT